MHYGQSFCSPDLTSRTVDQLMKSELYWYWQSVREGPSPSKESPVPDRRALTLLNADTALQLADEVEESCIGRKRLAIGDLHPTKRISRRAMLLYDMKSPLL